MALPPAITTMAPYVTGDQPMVAIGERPVGQWSAITPDYFATMGIPIVAGRAITAADTEQSPLVVVVSQGLARRAWPNGSPIGKRILVGRFPGFAEVVGVAGDVKNNGLAREPMAGDVHAVSAAAVAGDAVRGARRRRRSARAGERGPRRGAARSIASCRSPASKRWTRRWPIRSRPSG